MLKDFFYQLEYKISKKRYLTLQEALQRLFVKNSSNNQREIEFCCCYSCYLNHVVIYGSLLQAIF